MKIRTYLRVGYDAKRRKTQVAAGTKVNTKPLLQSDKSHLPTVAFAIDLEVPDEMFRQAERVIAELKIPEDAAVIAAEISGLAA